MAGDPAFLDWFVRWGRAGGSPSAAAALERMNAEIDVRDILPTIQVPTLVMNRTGDPAANVEAARDLAASIPGARFVELPGNTHSFYAIQPERVLAEIKSFITGTPPQVFGNRVLATILFADIVEATKRAECKNSRGMGELKWIESATGSLRPSTDPAEASAAPSPSDKLLAILGFSYALACTQGRWKLSIGP